REVDRLQREFEQAVGDYIPKDFSLSEAVDHCRRRYAKLAEKVQSLFTKHLEASGWPPQARFSHAHVFDTIVDPMTRQSGRKVAFFMVDALRYQLAITLHSELVESWMAEIKAGCARLSARAPIGMSSRLPGAGIGFRLAKERGGF